MTIYQLIVGGWLLVWSVSNIYAAVKTTMSPSARAYGIAVFVGITAIVVGCLHQGGFW